MKIKDGFIMRSIAGTNVVVAVGKASESFNGMIKLNETGAFLFGRMAKDVDVETLARELAAEYDVTAAEAKADVNDFTEKLISADIAVR